MSSSTAGGRVFVDVSLSLTRRTNGPQIDTSLWYSSTPNDQLLAGEPIHEQRGAFDQQRHRGQVSRLTWCVRHAIAPDADAIKTGQ
jgi:hypothetical protein